MLREATSDGHEGRNFCLDETYPRYLDAQMCEAVSDVLASPDRGRSGPETGATFRPRSWGCSILIRAAVRTLPHRLRIDPLGCRSGKKTPARCCQCLISTKSTTVSYLGLMLPPARDLRKNGENNPHGSTTDFFLPSRDQLRAISGCHDVPAST